jgi:hypothetical protein
MKFVVLILIRVEHAKTPAKHKLVETKRAAFHCLPDTRIANAVNAREMAERAFFQVLKALRAPLHPLQ